MCDCECNKVCKIDEYLDIKNCSCKKCLFDKLVLAREHEILQGNWTNLTIFWKLANNVFYVKIKR